MFIYRQTSLQGLGEIRNILVFIYGVGNYKAMLVTVKMGLSFPFRMEYLNSYYLKLLTTVLNSYTWLDIRIKRMINLNIKLKINNHSYKGLRHLQKLPVRGQRTRTNARTKKRYGK